MKFFGGVFTLIQTAIGSGILSLPFALSQTGIVTGFILLVVTMFLNAYSSLLLASLGTHISADYQTLTTAVLGRKFGTFFNYLLIVDAIMNLDVYLIIIKNLFPAAIVGIFGADAVPSPFDSPTFWGVVLILGCFFPLALLREVKNLQYLGMVGFIAIFYFVVLVVVEFFILVPTTERSESVSAAFSFDRSITQIFSSLPLFIYGYTFQFNVPSVYQSLQHRSYQRMASTIFVALAICVAVYLTFSVFGYLTQASLPSVAKNILSATPYQDRTEFHIGFIVYCVMLLMTSALRVKVAKESAKILLWNTPDLTPCRNFMITLVLTLICLTLALLVPHITVMIQIVGSTTVPIVCFIVPILFVLKLNTGGCKSSIIFAYFMMVVLILISAFALYSSIYEILA